MRARRKPRRWTPSSRRRFSRLPTRMVSLSNSSSPPTITGMVYYDVFLFIWNVPCDVLFHRLLLCDRDHAGGNEKIKQLVPGIKVYGGSIDNVKGCTDKVENGDKVSLGADVNILALHTPWYATLCCVMLLLTQLFKCFHQCTTL